MRSVLGIRKAADISVSIFHQLKTKINTDCDLDVFDLSGQNICLLEVIHVTELHQWMLRKASFSFKLLDDVLVSLTDSDKKIKRTLCTYI